MPILVMFAMIVLCCLPVAFLLYRAKKKNNAGWSAYAAARGLSFTPSRGFWLTWESAMLTGVFDGVPFAIDMLFERVGRGPAAVMRVRAHAHPSLQHELAAWPAGQSFVPRAPPPGPSLFSGGPTSGPTVLLGDRAFDAAFTVVTTAPAQVVQWVFGQRAREALVRFASVAPASVEIRRGEIALTWFGSSPDPARLDEACATVAAISRGGG